MYALRLSLAGTIILALLGGLGIAVVAQSEQGIAEGEVESALFRRQQSHVLEWWRRDPGHGLGGTQAPDHQLRLRLSR